MAHEWTGALAEPARSSAGGGTSMAPASPPAQPSEVRVRKPAGHGQH
ncbi:MAG: hypothetical protein IT503_20830 [Burkholderiaceae bacterium]|nr:hypothetical protein [Burkholderiaceae bacterium]